MFFRILSSGFQHCISVFPPSPAKPIFRVKPILHSLTTNQELTNNIMKTPHVIKCIVNLIKPLVAAVCTLLVMVGPAKAATYWWDVVSGDGATITDGSSAGNWETDLFWNDGLGWVDGNDAVFGGGSAGIAGTVTIGTTVAPTSLTFRQPAAGNYTLSGGTISLGAGTTIKDYAQGTTTINSNIGLTTNQTWTNPYGATLAIGGNINDGGGFYTNYTLEKQGAGTLTLTGLANVLGTLKATGGTLNLANTSVTLNQIPPGSNGYNQNGLVVNNALATISGNSILKMKGNVILQGARKGGIVMSGNANLDQQAATAENSGWYYQAFGGYLAIDTNTTITMKDNAYWGSYSDPGRTIKAPSRIADWRGLSGTFNMQDNASVNLDFPAPNSVGQYNTHYNGRVGGGGVINLTDSASMTTRVINVAGAEIFNQSGNSTVLVNMTNSTDAPGGTWTVSGNSTLSMPTATYTATNTRLHLRRMQLNIAGAGALVDLSNSLDDRSLMMQTSANEIAAVNLRSGTLVVKTVDGNNPAQAVGAQHSSFNFNGGTLKPAAASVRNATILGNNGLGSAVIYQGGAVVDTNGVDTTISQPLLAASNTGVLTIPVINGGSGYKFAPNVAFAGGVLGWSPTSGKQLGSAAAIVNLTGGSVSSVTIINPGSYVDISSLTFQLTGGDGSGAVLGPMTTGANISGGLTKQGAGTLTLSGPNTYSGPTAVNTGTLLARNARALGASPNVSVAPAAGLSYYAAADSPLGIGGTLTVTGGPGTTLGTSLGALPASARINVAGSASAIGNVALQVFGTAFTPTAGMAPTTYTLVQGGAGSTLNGAAYTPIAMNPTNFTLSNLAVSPATIAIDVTSQPALVGNVYWQGTVTPGIANVWAASNGNVGVPDSNWTAVLGGPVTPLVPGAGADVVISNAPVISPPIGTTLGADMTIRTLTISDMANGLGLMADPYMLTITPANPATGILMNAGVPASTIAANVKLGTSQTWTNFSSNPLTVSGGVFEASTLTNLTKAGPGTVILSGASTYTGATNVVDGTLQLTGTAGTPGTLSNLTTLNLGFGMNSGKFILGGPSSAFFQQNIYNLTTSGTGLANAVVSGNTSTPTAHIAPTLRVEPGGGTFAGFLGGATPTENNFNFIKGGASTLTLANPASTYSGVTSVFGGVLSVSSIQNAGVASSIGAYPFPGASTNSPTGTTGLLLAGGTLRYTGGPTLSDRGFALQGNSTIDVDSVSALGLGASALGFSTLTVNGTPGSLLALGATTIGDSATITNNATLSLASITEVNATDPKTLTIRGLGTTVSGAITQNANFALTVTKNNEGGTWILNGVNTYTGATNVQAGLLRINSPGSTHASSAVAVSAGAIGGTGTVNGPVTVSGSGGINLGDGAVGTLALGSTLGITGGAGANNLFFDLASGAAATDMITVVGNTTVNTAGAAVINLNQLGGVATPVTPGTPYTLIQGTGTMAAATQFALATSKAFGQSFTLGVVGNNLQVTTAAVTPATPAAFWSGATNGNWSTATNWNTDATSNIPTGAAPDYATNVTFHTTIPAVLNLSNTVDADFDINSLNFSADATSAVTIGGTKMLTIEASTANLNPAGNGITVMTPSSGTPTHTISAKVGLASSQTWTVNTGAALTVSGVINDFGGEYSLTKAGDGVLTLSGANIYAGGTTVSAGKLVLNNATALGRTTGAVGVAGGAVLDLNGQTVNNAFMTINGAGIALGGALISGTGTGTVNSTVVMASNSSIGGAGGLNLNGILRGNFNLTKVGAGTLQLNAQNSFGSAGTTFTIGTGTVQLGNAVGLGDAANNVNVTGGATLNLNGQLVANTNPLTITGTGVGGTAGALQNGTGTGTYAGLVTLAGPSTLLGNGNGIVLLNTGTITGPGFGLTLDGSGALNRIDSGIGTGVGGTLTKLGTGKWSLRGANTYTGGTTLTTGTLQFEKLVSMPAVGTVAVGPNTTLAVNVGGGIGEWTTGLAGPGTIGGLLAGIGGQAGSLVTYPAAGNAVTLGIDTANASVNNVATGLGTVTVPFYDSAVQTYSGVIADVGATLGLTKLGANTLALTGPNTYTGLTTVTGGVLQASNLQNATVASSIGNYAAAGAAGLILNGGTLQYTGPTTAVDRGFTLTGNSIIDVNPASTVLGLGTSSLGAFTLTAIGGAGSSLNLGAATVTGNATLVGGVPLTLASLSGTNQTVTFNGDVTVTGAVTFSDTAIIYNSNGRLSLSSINQTAASGKTITLRGQGTSSGSALGNNLSVGIVSGAITQNGANALAITKDDAGVWVLSNSNAYTGVTTVTNGVLRLDNANALPGGIGTTGGTSALTFNGGTSAIAVIGLTVASGDFTRPLAASGVVTGVFFNNAGGWAAYGADRLVNLGGASAEVIWANNPGFNGKQLNLGASSATNMVTLQNPLNLGTAVRTVLVEDGPAAIEGTLSGILTSRDGVGGALTKTGTGKLSLTSANTYFGNTTVSNGILVMGNPLALQYSAFDTTGSTGPVNATNIRVGLDANGSTTLTLGGLTGNVDVAEAVIGYGNITGITLQPKIGSVTYSGAIADGSGATSVTKAGAGTQVLSGAISYNSYTGGTIVNAGTLLWSGANPLPATGTLQVNSGGNFSLADGTAVATSTAALSLASAPTLTFDWNAGSVDTLISTAPATTVAGSVIGIGINPTNTPTGTGLTLLSAAGGGLQTGGTMYYLANNTNFTATLTQSPTAVTIGSYASVTAPTLFFWNGNKVTTLGAAGVDNALALSSGTATGSNWSTVQGTYTGTGVVPGSTADVIFSTTDGGNPATQQSTVMGADMTVKSVTFHDAIAAVTIGGSNTLTLTSTATGAGNGTAGGGSAITVTGTAVDPATINANVLLGANQTWNVAASKTLNVSGEVSGPYSLTKANPGTVVLSGVNTYTGPTTVSAGTLTVASSGTINNTSEVLIGAGNFKYNSSTALSRPVSFSATGGTLSGTGTITRPVIVTSGNTLSPGASAGPIYFSSGLTINAGGILNWEHTAGNALGTSGTSWDVVNVTGTTTISSTPTSGSDINLKFVTGTDFTNSFWNTSRTWKIIVGGVATGNLFDTSNIGIFVNEASVGVGNTITGEGDFSTVVNGTDLELKWTSTAVPSYATWAAAFTSPALSNQAADADPDNDGLTNAYEYIHGSDPRYTNQGGPTGSIVGTDLVLTFTRTDSAETPDVSLLVQVSTDLSDWTTISSYAIADTTANSSAGVVVTEGGTADDIITVSIPKGTDVKKFARLIVIVTP
jgi:autotransporter-associated beta strand protein